MGQLQWCLTLKSSSMPDIKIDITELIKSNNLVCLSIGLIIGLVVYEQGINPFDWVHPTIWGLIGFVLCKLIIYVYSCIIRVRYNNTVSKEKSLALTHKIQQYADSARVWFRCLNDREQKFLVDTINLPASNQDYINERYIRITDRELYGGIEIILDKALPPYVNESLPPFIYCDNNMCGETKHICFNSIFYYMLKNYVENHTFCLPAGFDVNWVKDSI